jgi:ABC-type transport system substrate-binding protein
VAHYFYETLFDRDKTGKVVPLLVREEQTSPDGLTLTWKLQPGVRFHDGGTFNAAAVKWNLERKIQRKQVLYDLLPIRSIEAVDDLTVRVTLNRPAPNMRATLSSKTFSMYSPAFVQRVGEDGIKTQASGTGPFRVVDYVPTDVLRMRKFPGYWQRGLPYLDEVVYRVAPDINARATMLEAGDVDMALGLSIPDIQRLKKSRGIKVLEGPGSRQYYMSLNFFRAPLAEARVRWAINHAVDKEALIKAVFFGAARVADAVYINPSVDGYVSAGSYKYEPERARKLLDEAGWRVSSGGIREKDGKPLVLELVTRKGSSAGDIEIAELVQGMLRAVGIDAKLLVLETQSFLARVAKPAGQAEYDLLNLTGGVFTGDAEYTMLTFYHTNSFPPFYYNNSYYSNTRVDQLIEQSQKATNRAERDKTYAQIVRQVYRDAPILMLFDTFEQVAIRDAVHGVYLERAGNNWPAKYAWKERK